MKFHLCVRSILVLSGVAVDGASHAATFALPSGVSDTSSAAAHHQVSIQRRLLPIERLRIAIDMSSMARELARARLWHEHPDWDEQRVAAEFLRQVLPPMHPATR